MDLPSLCQLLRCPFTGAALAPAADELRTAAGRGYPLVQGVPVFTPAARGVLVQPAAHLSNPLSPVASAVAARARGLVLNLSAGGSEAKPENVVELEYSIFRNTDVVGDAHQLPFADGVFAACICMNAFEHYRDPGRVAAEILRVLEPGGQLLMHTAALQPIHESPHHYYNATCFGVREWLSGFTAVDVTVSPNFNPAFAISWILSELEAGVRRHQGEGRARLLQTATVRDLLEFWRTPASRAGPLWQLLQDLDPETQRTCAAGWQATATKPLAPAAPAGGTSADNRG